MTNPNFPLPYWWDYTVSGEMLPDFYWNVKSTEERIKKICEDLWKLIQLYKMMVDAINDHETRIATLEEQMQYVLNQIALLWTKYNELVDEINRINEEIVKIENEINQIEKHLEQIDTSITEINNRIDQLIKNLPDIIKNLITTDEEIIQQIKNIVDTRTNNKMNKVFSTIWDKDESKVIATNKMLLMTKEDGNSEIAHFKMSGPYNYENGANWKVPEDVYLGLGVNNAETNKGSAISDLLEAIATRRICDPYDDTVLSTVLDGAHHNATAIRSTFSDQDLINILNDYAVVLGDYKRTPQISDIDDICWRSSAGVLFDKLSDESLEKKDKYLSWGRVLQAVINISQSGGADLSNYIQKKGTGKDNSFAVFNSDGDIMNIMNGDQNYTYENMYMEASSEEVAVTMSQQYPRSLVYVEEV